jgi:uncharacterized damage-inducible protein DinB
MSYDFNRDWLTKKFGEIRKRLLLAIQQLDDEQLNWRPDGTSHSIAGLIKHIEGNMLERIVSGMLHEPIQRDRDSEFTTPLISKEDLETIVDERFQFIIHTIAEMSDAKLEQTQQVRSRERTNLDMLHQCAAHYSEHMGQIFYIAKQCLQQEYKSTSV